MDWLIGSVLGGVIAGVIATAIWQQYTKYRMSQKLGDADILSSGLLAGVRNHWPLAWLEEPFHRSAVEALSSRSRGPFGLLR